MRVVLGVSGSIAAYKAVNLLRMFRDFHHEVIVVPTQCALQFVGAPTWEALSGQHVSSDIFSDVPGVRHVALGQQADLIVVAPASADLLARMAAGRANDLLTSTLLATQAPVVVAPAMHSEMWQHPATVENVATLRRRGVTVIEPSTGRLTGNDSGPGRLPEPEEIYSAAIAVAEKEASVFLNGKKILVTTGGTREAIDPVRFIGNHSSGKQGLRLAEAALRAGAEVRLIAAHVAVTLPPESARFSIERVGSSSELREAVRRAAPGMDAVIMAAAVADFQPTHYAAAKLKKHRDGPEMTLSLKSVPDILQELVQGSQEGASPNRHTPFIVGFAAETGDENYSVREHAYVKFQRKGCDMLVVNDVSAGKVFGADSNSVLIFDRTTTRAQAATIPEVTGTKAEIASAIIHEVAVRMRASDKIPSP